MLPERLPFKGIGFRLGSTWIPPEMVTDFVDKKLDVGSRVTYEPALGKWRVTVSVGVGNQKNVQSFGGGGMRGDELVEDALNLRSSQVFDTIEGPSGDKQRVKNVEATLAAQLSTGQAEGGI